MSYADIYSAVKMMLENNPNSRVNLSPIIERVLDDPRSKLDLAAILETLESSGYIQRYDAVKLQSILHIRMNYQGTDLYITDSGKFEREKLDRETATKIHVVNNGNFTGVVGAGGQVSFSDKAESQMVTTAPNIKDSTKNKIRWYNSILFKYIVWPLLVAIISGWIVYLASK